MHIPNPIIAKTLGYTQIYEPINKNINLYFYITILSSKNKHILFLNAIKYNKIIYIHQLAKYLKIDNDEVQLLLNAPNMFYFLDGFLDYYKLNADESVIQFIRGIFNAVFAYKNKYLFINKFIAKYIDITPSWLFTDTINYLIFRDNNIEALIFLLSIPQINKKIKEEFISYKNKHLMTIEMRKLLE